MAKTRSIASLLIFTGSVLCFFFSFVVVSCGGLPAFSLTGQQLATGTTHVQPQPFGQAKKQKIDADPFALVAGLCAIAGLGLSLLGTEIARATAISGGVGAASLFLMRSHMNGEIQKQGMGMVQANYATGFTIAILLLVAGAIWNIYLFIERRRMASTDT